MSYIFYRPRQKKWIQFFLTFSKSLWKSDVEPWLVQCPLLHPLSVFVWSCWLLVWSLVVYRNVIYHLVGCYTGIYLNKVSVYYCFFSGGMSEDRAISLSLFNNPVISLCSCLQVMFPDPNVEMFPLMKILT